MLHTDSLNGRRMNYILSMKVTSSIPLLVQTGSLPAQFMTLQGCDPLVGSLTCKDLTQQCSAMTTTHYTEAEELVPMGDTQEWA